MQSILIQGITILSPCFHAVVTVTECLPVALIPEYLLVSSMGNYMIHIGSFHVPTFFHAFHAQWMRRQESLPCFPPPAVIASFRGGPDLFRMKGFVFVAIFPSWLHELRTARMPARGFRFSWHWYLPVKNQNIKKAAHSS